MTVTLTQLLFYAGAVFILFITPGPVWVALMARAVSGGFQSAWPLAVGVVVGDAAWPLVAVFGVAWIVSVYANFLEALQWVAALMFAFMGIGLIRYADRQITSNKALTRPGMWAGFLAGVLVILGNPKAILFYMGILPAFFDFKNITAVDMALICLVSLTVPLAGNLSLALCVDQIRLLLSSPESLRRLNIGSGIALVCVAVIIVFT